MVSMETGDAGVGPTGPTASECHTPTEDGVELVLRGHGMLGLAHLGVLKAFVQNGVRIKKLTAMSLGSVVATLFANGQDISEIEKLLLQRKSRELIAEAWFGHGECHEHTRGEIQDLLPVARHLVEMKNLKPQDSLRLLCFDVVNRKTVAFEGTEYDLAIALAACCSVAGVMRPIRRRGSVLVDCSLYGCRVLHPCRGAATWVVDVSIDGDLQEKGLSNVDRFLQRRSKVVAPESACTDIVRSSGCRVMQVPIAARSLAACDCSTKSIRKIIAAGYKTAQQELNAIRLTDQS